MGLLRLKLFNDITNRRLVMGPAKADTFQFPLLFQEDKVNFELTFLEVNPDGGYNAPFSVINPSGFSLTIKLGAIGGAVLASSTSFAIGVPPNNSATSLVGTLDLNTANMVTAINAAGATQEITTTLEVELNDGTGKITTYQNKEVKVRAELILVGSPSALPLSSYLTSTEVDALYVKYAFNPAGKTIILVSPDGTKTRELGVDNNGAAIDNIT